MRQELLQKVMGLVLGRQQEHCRSDIASTIRLFCCSSGQLNSRPIVSLTAQGSWCLHNCCHHTGHTPGCRCPTAFEKLMLLLRLHTTSAMIVNMDKRKRSNDWDLQLCRCLPHARQARLALEVVDSTLPTAYTTEPRSTGKDKQNAVRLRDPNGIAHSSARSHAAAGICSAANDHLSRDRGTPP